MAQRPTTTVELLPEVPAYQRERIVSGMRWTVWLAALAVPFSYGTTTMLARTSPEALGTYGLLTVYISLVTAFFYFGGDTVVIRFVPELKLEERLSFLASYFLVICVALLPWLAAAAAWPGNLHYLFGERGGAPFQVLLLCLSPVCVLFWLVVAALKGMLEMRWAQTLVRVLTIGSFLLYVVLFFGSRALLATHYTEAIWGIYLGLAALATAIGVRRLLQLNGWAQSGSRLRFLLPRGFWRYALSNQQVTLLGFLIQRMDYILILNLGGLAVLGKYVAITAVATMIPVVNNFFLDTLLPSLTNLVASRNLVAAAEVFSFHMRILLFVNAVTTCGLMLLAGSLMTLLGPKYVPLRFLVVLMVLLVGLAGPGSAGGALLASLGNLQRAVWIGLGQLALYTVLFLSLWPRWQLAGAVLAYGVSVLAANTLLFAVAKHKLPIDYSGSKDYVKFALVAVVAGSLAAALTPFRLSVALPAWAGAVGVFLWLARYRFAECRDLVCLFAPASRISRSSLRAVRT